MEDHVIRFRVERIARGDGEGVQVVATYPDSSYDRGSGATVREALDHLAQKIADHLTEQQSHEQQS